METLIKTILDWIFHVAPAFLIRWYWTEDRLQRRVIIDVRPRGDAREFRGGEQPEVQIFLRVWNMAPFFIEVDRLKVDIWCSGCGEVCQPLQDIQKRKVPPAGFADILMRGGQGVNIETLLERAGTWPTANINIHAEIVSSVRNFSIQSSNQGFVRPSITSISNELRQKLFK